MKNTLTALMLGALLLLTSCDGTWVIRFTNEMREPLRITYAISEGTYDVKGTWHIDTIHRDTVIQSGDKFALIGRMPVWSNSKRLASKCAATVHPYIMVQDWKRTRKIEIADKEQIREFYYHLRKTKVFDQTTWDKYQQINLLK